MKKIVLLLALLATATLYPQSIEGNWYLNDKSYLVKLTIKGDTILAYQDLPYTASLDTILPADMVLRILKPEKNDGNKTSYTIQVIKGKKVDTDIRSAIFEVAGTHDNPMLLLNMIKNKDNPLTPPIKLITRKEVERYATLKDITQMDESTFITFANKVIALREEYKKAAFKSKEYYMSEVKFLLAEMGYNPLVRVHDLGTNLIDRFRDNPNTKELVETMGK